MDFEGAAERLTLVESHKSNAGYARVTQRGERARPFAAEGLCPHTRRRVSLGCYVTAEEAALAVARNHAAVDDGDAAAEWIGAGGSASTAYEGEYSDYGSYGEDDDDDEEEEEVRPPPPVKPPPRGKKSDEKRRGPKKPLVRDEDGTYRRPAGRGPPGKTWDARSGRWVGAAGEADDDDVEGGEVGRWGGEKAASREEHAERAKRAELWRSYY